MPPLKHEVRPEICAEESKNDKIWPLRATGYRSRHRRTAHVLKAADNRSRARVA